jgi:hypothetical protein
MKQSWKRVFVCSLAVAILIVLALDQASEGSVTGTVTGGTMTPSTTSATYLLSANTSSLAFGAVVVGKSGFGQLYLSNTGNRTVRISQVTTAGTGFKASGLVLPLTLAAGGRVALGITFAPTTTGSFTGTVSVASTATNSPDRISLSGTGVQPKISVVPSSVSFGSVPVGVTNTQTLTLSNPGSGYLSVTLVTAKGAGFTLSGLGLPLSIAPGHSSAFTVQFTPVTVGTISGTLSISSNAAASLTTVALGGSGVAPTLHLSANPALLSFGSILVGANTTKTVTLSNTGNTKVSVSLIKASGAGFSVGGFAVPFTLAAGQSASFTASFAPAILGSSAGSVTVTSTATNSPAAVSVSGSGVQAAPRSVLLSWTASNSSVVGYHIYRGTQTAGPFARLSPTVIAGTSYTDTTVQSAHDYYYVATAIDSAGTESSYSNEISVVVP